MKIRIFYFYSAKYFTQQFIANTQYFKDGLNLFKNQKFIEAKFKFEQDILHNPKNEISYLYLSKIFNNLDNKDLEEQNLKQSFFLILKMKRQYIT